MKLIFSLVIIFCLSACYYDNEEELYPSNMQCETEGVRYSVDIRPIINKSCATPSCHVPGGTGNGSFLYYDVIKQKVENGSFEDRVIVQQDMPPNGDLSSCEIELIKAWLDQGAPIN